MSDLIDNLKGLADELAEFNKRKRKEAVQGGTNRPYYREGPAVELRAVIDQLFNTRATQIIALDPSINFNTQRNKISQASKYLLDHLDPDGHYRDMWPHVEITHREKTKLTYFKFKSTPMKSTSIPNVGAELVDALEKGIRVNDIFERTGLTLTNAEISALEGIVAKLDGAKYISAVSRQSVVVARVED